MTSVSLRPNWLALTTACAFIALISWVSLPWPAAIASVILGTLAFAGAEIDARTFHLPDTVTLGATACGSWRVPHCFRTAADERVRSSRARGRRGSVVGCPFHRACVMNLGFERKLGAAVGAWLSLEQIPLCFLLATAAALIAVLFSALRGERIERSMRLPFGAFLCPALWLAFYVDTLRA